MLQLRVEMGVLQMEVDGRPDGSRPGGYPTCLDWLHAVAAEEGESFALDERRCLEIDREFVQFFHRRVAWLALREFERAVADADHTLALMDFSSLHAPDVGWAEMHEQYRPFVLFHRTQAAALGALERDRRRSRRRRDRRGDRSRSATRSRSRTRIGVPTTTSTRKTSCIDEARRDEGGDHRALRRAAVADRSSLPTRSPPSSTSSRPSSAISSAAKCAAATRARRRAASSLRRVSHAGALHAVSSAREQRGPCLDQLALDFLQQLCKCSPH